MINHLVVTKPFLNFVRGDVIADETKATHVLAGEYRKFVTKIATSSTVEG
jgi:hypothetical protein